MVISNKLKNLIENFEAMIILKKKGAEGQEKFFSEKEFFKLAAIEAGRADICKTILESEIFKSIKKTIQEEKLMMSWMEGELIGGDKVFYLDESHGVIISWMGYDGYIIKFAQRVKENGKYYCRIVKKFEIKREDIPDEKTN